MPLLRGVLIFRKKSFWFFDLRFPADLIARFVATFCALSNNRS